MRTGHISLALLAILSVAGASQAEMISVLAPNPADLGDLDHSKVYRWGFDVTLPAGEQISSATLTLTNIRNWDDDPNMLYIHLLDQTSRGVNTNDDNQGGGDYFANKYTGVHQHLVTYVNLPDTAQTIVYNFTPADLATLNAYLANGRAGLGFDPDCHFYNSGVSLQIRTPEPAVLAQLLAALPILLRRRTRNAGR